MSILKQLYTAVIEGNAPSAKQLTEEALEKKIDPQEVINAALIPAMDEVGRLFECDEYYVPELLIAARAMKQSLELINPLLAARGSQPMGHVVIGTVQGDLHDIGKNLVASMLEGAGFSVTDLGVDVPPEKFIESIKTDGITIVAISALLTTTTPAMKSTIEAFEAVGKREHVKIMVGGAPVTEKFANAIGADGFSANASGAVTIARQLIKTHST